mgnify:CR=1 FL=1
MRSLTKEGDFTPDRIYFENQKWDPEENVFTGIIRWGPQKKDYRYLRTDYYLKFSNDGLSHVQSGTATSINIDGEMISQNKFGPNKEKKEIGLQLYNLSNVRGRLNALK